MQRVQRELSNEGCLYSTAYTTLQQRLLLQRVLTRIGLAQCAYTNAVFCYGWYPESSRFLQA